MEARGWADERLKTMVLQAVALHVHGEKDKAVQVLGEALALAEPGGFIRLFVDEGLPMARLLREAASHGRSAGLYRQVAGCYLKPRSGGAQTDPIYPRSHLTSP